uniref:Candidate secreted effector n=1 Tax=Meloidogyne incognita TaxID=6306 RepID=A0A914KYI7_MELIC
MRVNVNFLSLIFLLILTLSAYAELDKNDPDWPFVPNVRRIKRHDRGCSSNYFSCEETGCWRNSNGRKGCNSVWSGKRKNRRLTCRCLWHG